ncbi:MAG: sensor histidine kinase [Bacteroidota bacterium]
MMSLTRFWTASPSSFPAVRGRAFWWGLVLAAALLMPLFPAQAQTLDGYLIDRKSGETFAWRLYPDSVVVLQADPRGAQPPAPLVLPWPLAKRLTDHLIAAEPQVAAPQVAAPAEHVHMGYEDSFFYLNLMQPAAVIRWMVMGSLFSMLLLGITLVLHRRLRREREEHQRALERQRMLIEGREKERGHLARELHDGPMQDLQLVNMNLARWSHTPRGPTDPAAYQVKAEAAQAGVQHVVRELRRTCQALRPPTLASFGLVPSLRALADRVQERSPLVTVAVALDEEVDALPEQTALAFYRIAQEGLNNAVQHGQATSLHLELQSTDTQLALRVRDDGAGFEVPADWMVFGQEGHYGLLGMAERVEALGGSFSVRSNPGRGTTLVAAVPYHMPSVEHLRPRLTQRLRRVLSAPPLAPGEESVGGETHHDDIPHAHVFPRPAS